MVPQILHLIVYIGFHGLGLLHNIFSALSILISGLCMLYHSFIAYFPVNLPLATKEATEYWKHGVFYEKRDMFHLTF
jgi:hypothetical protein